MTDRFRINGVELVPICKVGLGGKCLFSEPLLPGEELPYDLVAWYYFRTRTDDSVRYFFSPDHRTWKSFSKSGIVAEFGFPRDKLSDNSGADLDSRYSSEDPHVFRWNLVRLWGNGGANVVMYRWQSISGSHMGYLTDIFDTAPAAANVKQPAEIPLDQFAHHTRLAYNLVPPNLGGLLAQDAALWAARRLAHLDHVDITSKDFKAPEAARRHLVRRYSLYYLHDREHRARIGWWLNAVRLTGACPDIREGDDLSIPHASCGTQERYIAKMSYTGRGVSPNSVFLASAPFERQYLGDQDKNGIMWADVNSDGQPDVMATTASPPMTLGLFTGNGWDKQNMSIRGGTHTLQEMYFRGALGSWNNDGRVNILMWQNSTGQDPGTQYTIYTPQRGSVGTAWFWVGATHENPNQAWRNLFLYNDPLLSVGRQDFDVDGDGLPDSYIFSRRNYPDEETYDVRDCTFFTTRDAMGNSAPYARGPANPNEECIPPAGSSGPSPSIDEPFAYADLSGDGILDRVTRKWVRETPQSVFYNEESSVAYGWGNGSFRGGRGLRGRNRVHQWLTWYPVYFADLNGDGVAEKIELRNNDYEEVPNPDTGIYISWDKGGAWYPEVRVTPDRIANWRNVYRAELPGGGYGTWHNPMRLDFIPNPQKPGTQLITVITETSDGSKFNKIVTIEPDFGDAGNTSEPTGLLETIENGLGATTKVTYGKHIPVAGMPTAIIPVEAIRTTSNADRTSTGGPFETFYDYEEPVYGYREGRFLGFRKVRQLIVYDGGGYSATDTRYLIASCQDSAGKETACPAAVDDPRSAVRGLPVTVDQWGGNPVKHVSLSHQTYRMDKLYTGLDGRVVRRIYSQQTETRLFDTSNYVTDAIESQVTDLVADDLTLNKSEWIPSQTRSVILRNSTELDLFGNQTSATDYGVVNSYDPVVPVDSPIVSIAEWAIPAGDTSRWLWRLKDSYVRESAMGANLRHSHFEYDTTGNILKTFGDLTGTLPLQRFHEDSAEVAPPPADASQDGVNILRSEVTYDAFGNPSREKNATGMRCTDTGYELAYGHLPVSQTVYIHGCGGVGLTTTTIYDRGLEVPTETIEPTGAKSTAFYDGFGRLTATYKPRAVLGVLAESQASTKITYFDVEGGPYQRTRVETRDDDGTELHYHSSWTYTDPFGQTSATVSEADPSADDEEPYIVNGKVERNNQGLVVKAFQPYFATVDPESPMPPAGTALSTRVLYDPFGHVTDTFGLANEPQRKILYHALSQETFEAADLVQGATPHPRRTVVDGHGRARFTVRTTNQNGTADTISTETIYLPTGEIKAVRRSHSSGADVYTREMQYDSWGRRVKNEEPNTSINRGTSNVRAWRYAYNDSNDLVGTSDARGCGRNVEWDGAGRLVSEIYSPCLKSQRKYDGHVTNLFIYDAPEGDNGGNPALFAGRLAASYDRAQHTRYTYDGRGRTMIIERQLAVPDPEDQALGGGGGPPSAEPGGEYAPHWYRTASSYDEADRERGHSVGARSTEVEELYGNPVSSGWLAGGDVVVTTYSKRGIMKTVGSSYGNLVIGRKVDADGFVRRIDYGEAASPTVTYQPDDRRRIARIETKANSTPTVLQDWTLGYDVANNPTQVTDNRTATEWPEGSKPVSRQMSYDDLNQLRRVDYNYGGADDKQVSPFDAEAKNGDMRPIPESPQSKRVKWQTYAFDWQGNLTKSDDDRHAFHDRSAGTITYGTTSNDGPNRAASATGVSGGRAQATYDRTGNLIGLNVVKIGPAGNPLDITFSYEWDEIGQMIRARRAPISGVSGDGGVDFHYTYNAEGTRVTKSVEDPHTHERTYSNEIFPSLRLDHAQFQNGDYELTKNTVTVYLVANGIALARVVYDENMPRGPIYGPIGGAQHVLFTLTDPMGSTSTVIDKWSGELVEQTTYLAYGQPESDYRPERWKSFREHYRFTGKEDDVGVGLTYFGARYYVPSLGQWASADPLTIHELGSDPNPYAYVMGSPLRFVDPVGLDICDFCIGGGGGWDGGWARFFAGAEAASFDWTQSGGGDRIINTGMLPMEPPKQITLYKHTERDYWAVVPTTLTREQLSRDPDWWAACGKNPWCAPAKDIKVMHADSMWEPIGISEAVSISNMLMGLRTGKQDRPLEKPLIDPIDVAGGVIGTLGKAAVGKLATRGLGELFAEEAGAMRIAGTKAPSLPAWSKVTVDQVHVLERHVPGAVYSPGRTVFPSTMNEKGIMRAIRQAYMTSSKVGSQGTDRLLLQGQGGGLTIEMWFNKATKTIETAYPVTR